MKRPGSEEQVATRMVAKQLGVKEFTIRNVPNQILKNTLELFASVGVWVWAMFLVGVPLGACNCHFLCTFLHII